MQSAVRAEHSQLQHKGQRHRAALQEQLGSPPCAGGCHTTGLWCDSPARWPLGHCRHSAATAGSCFTRTSRSLSCLMGVIFSLTQPPPGCLQGVLSGNGTCGSVFTSWQELPLLLGGFFDFLELSVYYLDNLKRRGKEWSWYRKIQCLRPELTTPDQNTFWNQEAAVLPPVLWQVKGWHIHHWPHLGSGQGIWHLPVTGQRVNQGLDLESRTSCFNTHLLMLRLELEL